MRESAPTRWPRPRATSLSVATLYINGKFTAQHMTGVQRYAHNLVRALDAGGGKRPVAGCVLVCPPSADVPRLRRIRVWRIGPARLPLHAWEQVCLPWATRSGLLLNLAGSAPLFAARQCCTFHDAAVFDHPEAYTPLFGAWYRRNFRWQARHAERLLTVSAHSRQRLAERLGIPASAIGVVPNGGDHLQLLAADDSVLARVGLHGQRFALAVGSANVLKNLSGLRRAWQLLPAESGLRLVIVGGSDAAVFAGETDSACPRDARVVEVGRIDDAALKSLYQHATMLVFPSLDEGFGLPPLEAMALGCPVAAAASGAVPEVCGDAALYFDPRDPASIADAVQRMVGDAPLRDRLVRAGMRRAAAFTWESSAESLLAELPLPRDGAP